MLVYNPFLTTINDTISCEEISVSYQSEDLSQLKTPPLGGGLLCFKL